MATMISSSQHFFIVPELLELLTSHLEKEDVSRLSRTSRSMNSRLSPSLFKILYGDELSKIFNSTTSTLALGRNTRHVRELSLGSEELAYYYNCVQAFEELKEQTIDNVPAPRPSWHPPSDPRTCPVFALPPLTQLSRLNLHSFDPRTSKVKVPSADNPRALLAQLCWLITLNPHLTSLTVPSISLEAVGDYLLFLRTVTQLNGLEKLDIEIKFPCQRGFQQGLDFFNCLPPTMKTFIYRYGQMSWDESPGDQDGRDLVTTLKRQGPLLNVVDLKLWTIGEKTSLMDIVSIFAQCPNLEELKITGIAGQHNVEAIGKSIGKECPKIHELIYSPDYGDENGLLPYWIATGLPPQQLTSFDDMGDSSDLNHPSASIAIQQHSTTLRHISLGESHSVYSWISPAVIFDNCVNLEILNLRFGDGGVVVDLEDTQGAPWCCTKLQELTVAICGCELPEEDEDEITPRLPHYARPSPITLTDAETQHFSWLENLYIQIGRLTELQYLHMRMIKLEERDDGNDGIYLGEDQTPTVSPSFPAMLSLGSTQEGRPGYLHHLAELSKLEMITGSIRADTDENKAMMGLEECVWIDQHWPLLNRADLFPDREDIRPPFIWLMDQRKHGRCALELDLA
ncbi:MAG: hypothetical protein J3R72DRAFT_445836 [Linnemannia gamsii]|nr:MAG: hypothetical protein J3R72DRAFT_445836 [Linnemannia gamsii]